MAATICEDHQDYETDGTFQKRISEKGKTLLRLTAEQIKHISTYLEHSQALFHTHTVGPYSTGSKCARVLLSQDVL